MLTESLTSTQMHPVTYDVIDEQIQSTKRYGEVLTQHLFPDSTTRFIFVAKHIDFEALDKYNMRYSSLYENRLLLDFEFFDYLKKTYVEHYISTQGMSRAETLKRWEQSGCETLKQKFLRLT